MKTVIKRNLPLNVKYSVIDRKYIPLVDGGGYCCDNCGKLIANIATVKSINGVFHIGFDCLETFLVNNGILDGFDPGQHETIKKSIPKILRFSKQIKETLSKYSSVTGVLFERPQWDYVSYYWLQNKQTNSRDNDSIKLKDVPFDFLIETLKNIFPKLDILIKP